MATIKKIIGYLLPTVGGFIMGCVFFALAAFIIGLIARITVVAFLFGWDIFNTVVGG